MSIQRIIFLLLFVLGAVDGTRAQPVDQLILHLSFDDCSANDVSGFNRLVSTNSAPACICGPEGSAFAFDGADDFIQVDDTTEFLRLGYTLSFYFKPYRTDERMLIMSKSDSCTANRGLFIYYDGPTNTVTAEIAESLGERLFFSAKLEENECWQHLVIERSGERNALHLNGEKVDEQTSSGFLNLANTGLLTIGSGACVPEFYTAFEGGIDEVRLYSRTFAQQDIRTLYRERNFIVSDDTLLFQGDTYTPSVDAPCAISYQWTPTTGVSNPNIKEPQLSPDETITYRLRIEEDFCAVEDTIRIIVVNPDDVTCERLILPSAFTPNADGLNDRFIISNGFILDELIRFEIFDRQGGRLFSTSRVSEGWDGRHRGEYVMPGVYIYKAEWRCNGEEKVQAGSFAVLN